MACIKKCGLNVIGISEGKEKELDRKIFEEVLAKICQFSSKTASHKSRNISGY